MGDPSDAGRAKCLVCPLPRDKPNGLTFSIAEGFSEIWYHNKSKTHVKCLQEHLCGDTVDETNALSQLYIEGTLRNQDKLAAKQRKVEAQLQLSYIQFCYSLHAHSLPSRFFACFSKIVPKLFPDSNFAKHRGESGTKGT